MRETIGSLDLKIARLRQRLDILRQQEKLSEPYPRHRAALAGVDLKLRLELYRLLKERQIVVKNL